MPQDNPSVPQGQEQNVAFKRPKAPFCWQEKANLRYIRSLRKRGIVRQSQSRNMIDAFRALTEMISDFGQGEMLRCANLPRRLGGYAEMGERSMKDALNLLEQHRVIRRSQVKNARGQFSHTEIELLRIDEGHETASTAVQNPHHGEAAVVQNSAGGFSAGGKLPPSEVDVDVEVEDSLKKKNDDDRQPANTDPEPEPDLSYQPEHPELQRLRRRPHFLNDLKRRYGVTDDTLDQAIETADVAYRGRSFRAEALMHSYLKNGFDPRSWSELSVNESPEAKLRQAYIDQGKPIPAFLLQEGEVSSS